MSSFIISFNASAMGCRMPCQPTRYGPIRDCMRAANFRSSSVTYVDHADHGIEHDEARNRPATTGWQRAHRSTSPNTGSTEPMIATTSATPWPGMMCGRIARLENDAPRHFIRYGLRPAIADDVTPHFAARSLDARVSLALRHSHLRDGLHAGPREIGPSGRPSRIWRTMRMDSRNSTIRTL